jgi:hypothetical protein
VISIFFFLFNSKIKNGWWDIICFVLLEIKIYLKNMNKKRNKIK